MIERIKHYYTNVTSGFWLIPAVITGGVIGVARISLALDRHFEDKFTSLFPEITAEGLRSLLELSSSSILTLAGLVFSATLIALTLASSQYGPRLLNNFIQSRGNQLVLGILLGNFVFSLTVLRSVSEANLPHLSTLIAFVLTLTSLGAFIFFVHHITHSLKAESIVAGVAAELNRTIERLFPEKSATPGEDEDAEKQRNNWDDLVNERAVAAVEAGYLLRIDIDNLVDHTVEYDIRARAISRPGQLVMLNSPLLAYERSESLSEDQVSRLLECFIIGDRRTPEQDFEFEIRELVEIAVRSLSPGINDPFTAINCIDLLGIALSKIAQRQMPRRVFLDAEGQTRLRTRPATFRSLLESAYLQLRYDASNRPDVTISLLRALREIARSVRTLKQHKALLEMAELIRNEACESLPSDYDHHCIEEIVTDIEKMKPSGK